MELTPIPHDDLKVGDVVYIKHRVTYGWNYSYRHSKYKKATITRITPKRTKFVTTIGEYDHHTQFYPYSDELKKEHDLATEFASSMNYMFDIYDNRTKRLPKLTDDEIHDIFEHISAIHKIMCPKD